MPDGSGDRAIKYSIFDGDHEFLGCHTPDDLVLAIKLLSRTRTVHRPPGLLRCYLTEILPQLSDRGTQDTRGRARFRGWPLNCDVLPLTINDAP